MKIDFIIVSKDTKFEMEQDAFSKVPPDIEINVVYVPNNTKSLAEVYNEHLRSERAKNDKCDCLVFMHGDVEFDVGSFAKHLEKVSGKYGIVGLCGASTLNVSQSPLNWFTGSANDPNSRWGCVMHGELKNQMSWFSQHSPDVGDHEVACIDGLCIIFTKTAIDSKIEFDTSIGKYNCYDTSLCLDAMLNYNLKIGVIVRKDLVHYSVGKGILNQDFLKDEYSMRRKFNLPIPDQMRQILGK